MDHKDSLSYQPFEVLGNTEVAPGTHLLDLRGKLNFEPGQFIQLSVDHIGEATFAPCSDPNQKNRFQVCVRAVGNTTNHLVKSLPGDKLKARGPYGNSWPIEKLIGKNVIIVAGGLGIVPLRPLLFELIKYKKEFKKIYLLGGFKTPEHVIFKSDWKYWHQKFDYVKLAVEKGNASWYGEVCMITELIDNLSIDTKNTLTFMCGPEIMFNFCSQILFSKHVAGNQIYVSYEKRMECGIGICQHCNVGKYLVCKDGPIFRYDIIEKENGK